jgi:hypothetical protein
MLHGVVLFGVSPMPVLNSWWYVHDVTLNRIQCLAAAHLHPPAPLQEVEHLLSTMDVPERPRSFLEGHTPDEQLAGLVGGYRLDISSICEIVGRSLLSLYIVHVFEN